MENNISILRDQAEKEIVRMSRSSALWLYLELQP